MLRSQWIVKNRNEAVAKLAGKIEPPFSESKRRLRQPSLMFSCLEH